MEKSKILALIGCFALIAGILMILYGTRILEPFLPVSVTSMVPGLSVIGTIPEGKLGVSMHTSSRSLMLFDMITPGNQYEWSVEVENTGTVTWESGNLDIRIGKPTSTIVDKTADWLIGTMKVFSCASGIDVPDCREDPYTTWQIEINENYPAGTWTRPATSGNPDEVSMCRDRVCYIQFGGLAPGQTKTVGFRLTTPSGRTSSSPSQKMILQTFAHYGKYEAVAVDIRDLEYGALTGRMTVTFIGLVLSILGLIGLAFALR